MKKIVTGAIALLLITGAAQAQKTPGGKHQRRAPMEQLALTADQQAKLKTIRENHKKERQELKSQDNITVKEWKARREALAQKQRTEIASVLTPEQAQQLAKKHQGHRKNMKGAPYKRGRNMEQLELTNAQKEKVKAINTSFKKKREALRSNTALADAQKKEQLKTLTQQRRQEVNALLTPAQQQKLEAARSGHRAKNAK